MSPAFCNFIKPLPNKSRAKLPFFMVLGFIEPLIRVIINHIEIVIFTANIKFINQYDDVIS